MTVNTAFNPGTFQANVFQHTVSPYVYPNDLMNLSIEINGVDVTEYLDLETFEVTIVSILKKIPECTFDLFDVPASVSINKWMTVEIKDNVDVIFSGYVMNPEGEESDLTYCINWTVSCVGQAKLLSTKLVRAQKFDNQDDSYIINYLITQYLPEVDALTYVSTLRTFPEIPFGRKYLSDVLDYLCSITGGSYYIDYRKALHYFGSEVIASDFGFSDTPDLSTTYPYRNFREIDNGNENYNVVEVVGGYYLSVDETSYHAGNGSSNRIMLPLKYQAPTGYSSILVWRNDGTEGAPVWTQMIVKAAYLYTADWSTDCLYYYQEKILEQQDAWPNLTNAIKITARYEAKVRVRVEDPDAIESVGREIEYPYYDDSIIDKEVARALGRELLAQSANSKTYKFETEKRGLIAGMMVPVKNDTFSVDTSLLIQKVTTNISVGGMVKSIVEVGKYHPTLVDILVNLKKASSKSETYTSEGSLDSLKTFTETISATETTSVTAS